MKKSTALLMALIICLTFAGCGATKQKAFKLSKSAYENINAAYEMINVFSKDIYEAWRLGINDSDSFDGKYRGGTYNLYTYYDDAESLAYFANELFIPERDLKRAVAKMMAKDTYDAGSKNEMGDWYFISNIMYDSFFSACVDLVSTAYEVNGTVSEIVRLLEEAKEQMKKLSDNYSDYEHYPNLKEYFTNTTAFLGFCINPEGSFDQVVETFNNYRNDARDYYYALNYVFEDSIFPEIDYDVTDGRTDDDDDGFSESKPKEDSTAAAADTEATADTEAEVEADTYEAVGETAAEA